MPTCTADDFSATTTANVIPACQQRLALATCQRILIKICRPVKHSQICATENVLKQSDFRLEAYDTSMLGAGTEDGVLAHGSHPLKLLADGYHCHLIVKTLCSRSTHMTMLSRWLNLHINPTAPIGRTIHLHPNHLQRSAQYTMHIYHGRGSHTCNSYIQLTICSNLNSQERGSHTCLTFPHSSHTKHCGV